MSKTLSPLAQPHPLHLDYFEPGSFHMSREGVVHRKTTPFAILIQVRKGYYWVEQDSRRFRIDAGKLFFVPANRETVFEHHDGSDNLMHVCWIHFRFSLYRMFDYLSFFEVPIFFSGLVAEELREIFRQTECLNGTSQLLEMLPKRHVLGSCLLEAIIRASERNEQARQVLGCARLKAASDFIRMHISEPLTVERLAQVAGLSPSRFHAIFLENYGISPMRFVNSQRMEMAARILVSQDVKLSVVAEQVGYADAFHFSHAFKAHFGISPRNYRRQAVFAL